MHYSERETPDLQPVETGMQFTPGYCEEIRQFEILPEKWTFVASARFGELRPLDGDSKGCWSGHSYRFDIFRKDGCLLEVGLRYEHGGGHGWLIARRTTDMNALLRIAQYENEAERWDACKFLYEIAMQRASAARRSEHNEMCRLFAAGKLKKRKVRGREEYKVTVED